VKGLLDRLAVSVLFEARSPMIKKQPKPNTTHARVHLQQQQQQQQVN